MIKYKHDKRIRLRTIFAKIEKRRNAADGVPEGRVRHRHPGQVAVLLVQQQQLGERRVVTGLMSLPRAANKETATVFVGYFGENKKVWYENKLYYCLGKDTLI